MLEEQAFTPLLQPPEIPFPALQLALQAPGAQRGGEAARQHEDRRDEGAEDHGAHQHPGQSNGVLQAEEVELHRAPVLGQEQAQDDAAASKRDIEEQKTQQAHGFAFLLALRPLSSRTPFLSLLFAAPHCAELSSTVPSFRLACSRGIRWSCLLPVMLAASMAVALLGTLQPPAVNR